MPGSSYCSYAPEYECYEFGWPSCCLDDPDSCPEEKPSCDPTARPSATPAEKQAKASGQVNQPLAAGDAEEEGDTSDGGSRFAAHHWVGSLAVIAIATIAL
jgi:hypothetical protein